jgi:alpha-tubulin suppressor-like RCC1 family protein
VAVSGISNAVAISAGWWHTCALLASGGIDCWGSNGSGQLGIGTYGGSHSTPVPVSGISNAIAISAGGEHTCALLSGGGVDCWGANYYGELGDGSAEMRLTPVPVSGITNATAISASQRNHTCALLSGGGVDCWGANFSGQLGNGTEEESWTAVAVSGITNAVAVSAGGYHSCALLAGGMVDCWGEGGLLGDGSGEDSLTPVAVVAPD